MTRYAKLMLLILVSACRRAPEPPPAVLAEAKQQLEERGRTDQAVREGFGTGGTVDSAQAAAMARTDSANSSWLKAHVERWGWPTTAQVGRNAVQAAFLIVQHAVHDTAFMRSMLPLIEDAHRRGDLDGGSVAMLTDRLEVKAGRPQIYGTQLSLKDGRWVFDSIADSAGVDSRRMRMGLPTLAEYRRLVDSLFQTSSNSDSAPVSGADRVDWIQIVTDSGVVRAAVARPQGRGPFPALLILHGTHGFAEEYVQLAREMAQQGVLGVAACWFRGRRGAGTRFITPIDCPRAPPLVEASLPERFRLARLTIDTLVRTVRRMPNVRADRVALFGHSRGAGATLDYLLTHPGEVQAAILNSAGYPVELRTRATEINVPLLILHGTADGPADGGSAFTNVEMARGFAEAMRSAGKVVETKYYDGAGHNGLFSSSSQHQDAVERITAFLRTFASPRATSPR